MAAWPAARTQYAITLLGYYRDTNFGAPFLAYAN
jgi:hypothetical protein